MWSLLHKLVTRFFSNPPLIPLDLRIPYNIYISNTPNIIILIKPSEIYKSKNKNTIFFNFWLHVFAKLVLWNQGDKHQY